MSNTSPPPPSPSPAEEIYVNYLPVPPKLLRSLRWSIPLSLWVLCIVTFLWASSQPNPGSAVWEDGKPIKLQGIIISQPYPILFTQDSNGLTQAVVLVEVGKIGSLTRSKSLNGRPVIASGWPLHRDGRRMLELEPNEQALIIDDNPPTHPPLPTIKPIGPITLRGEIVDSKCFLGAMKPGEGKTHKECATLCIRGGIPPMFITRDAAGTTTYYLLQSPTGGPIDPALHPFIADPIEINADLSTWGNLNILNVRPESLRHL